MMYLLQRLLLGYLILVALVALIQRKLLYPASRADSLKIAQFPDLQKAFRGAQDLELRTSDGVLIRGWHLQVADSRSDRVILLFHGNGGHRAHRSLWYEMALSMNADILAIDYHGYGDSEGKPTEAHLIADAEAVWNHAIKELKYEPSQIVITGESLGGGVSVQLAAAKCGEKQEPGGLVLVATFSSMLDVASSHYRWLPVPLLLLDRYRSDKHIGDITCPILQFHGDRDSIVALKFGRRLHELAPKQSSTGRPKQFITFAGSGHNDLLYLNAQEVRDRIATFMRPQPASTP